MDLKFIPGLCENSLTVEFREELRRFPPTLVSIDVDFHSSTRTILE
ncbi:MAG: hypothetical protein L3K14_09660 [Thermoplasmata archaeon]|nr:hypothetical protein [Thermoplasmata archaeon]